MLPMMTGGEAIRHREASWLLRITVGLVKDIFIKGLNYVPIDAVRSGGSFVGGEFFMSDEFAKTAVSSSNTAGSRRRRRSMTASKAKDLRVYLSEEEQKRLDELALEFGSQAEAVRRALDLLLEVKRENQMASRLDEIQSGLRRLRETASSTYERGEFSIALQKSVESDLKKELAEVRDSQEDLRSIVSEIFWDLKGFLATLKTSAEVRAKADELKLAAAEAK